MIKYLLPVLLAFSLTGSAQNQFAAYYNRVFEARYMDKPPIFPYGKDSLQRFYFQNFPAFDTLIRKAIEKGDTAKYIRIYFSFNIDQDGFVYEPRFERIASTRSSVTEQAKTIRYFNGMKHLMENSVKEMLMKMPQWRPGLENGQPVRTANHDFLQFWVGLSDPD